MPRRLTLPARLRLRRKKDFDAAYARGRRLGDGFFGMTATLNTEGAPRLGLAVAVRVAGGAVERNRIRRVIKESFRLHQARDPGGGPGGQCAPQGTRCPGPAAARVPRRTVEESRRSMRYLAAAPDPPLPVDLEPAARAHVPLLPELLAVRAAVDPAFWFPPRQLAHPAGASGAAIRGTRAASTRCRRRALTSARTTLMNNILPNNPRIYLWVALGMLGLLNYQAWMKDYASAAGAHRRERTGGQHRRRAPRCRSPAPTWPAASRRPPPGAAAAPRRRPPRAVPRRRRRRPRRRRRWRACTSRPTCWMWRSAPAAARSSGSTCWPTRW